MDTSRAIQQGIDAARCLRKDAHSPYHDHHPLFRYWWEAVVLKSDAPSLDDTTIQQAIRYKLRNRK